MTYVRFIYNVYSYKCNCSLCNGMCKGEMKINVTGR